MVNASNLRRLAGGGNRATHRPGLRRMVLGACERRSSSPDSLAPPCAATTRCDHHHLAALVELAALVVAPGFFYVEAVIVEERFQLLREKLTMGERCDPRGLRPTIGHKLHADEEDLTHWIVVESLGVMNHLACAGIAKARTGV